MRSVLLFVLVLWATGLRAQPGAPLRAYPDPQGRFRLSYPASWQLYSPDSSAKTVFYAGQSRAVAPALVQLMLRPVPAAPPLRSQTDSLRRLLQQLPGCRIRFLTSANVGSHQEISYDYSYAPGPDTTVRAHMLGRQLWQQGQEFWLEYRDTASRPEACCLAEGQALLQSFVLTPPVSQTRTLAPGPTAVPCDDKMYGIAALRYRGKQWEDDCRTIHEFSVADLRQPPIVHREALPFQSYALAKGFDNRLYSATKAPTNQPEYVYCYDPATRQGHYTPWQLPAQGPDVVWVSAATDAQGDLYFMTSDAGKLVKVSPADGSVRVLWTTDPARQTPYYASITFAGAGSHGNFGLDESGTIHEVYSTDGSLVRINLVTHQADSNLLILTGLPRRGGYSDLLFQKDAAGRRRLYLAGPQALYEVDPDSRQARFVRRGIYTDLAGCNLFRKAPSVPVVVAGPELGPAGGVRTPLVVGTIVGLNDVQFEQGTTRLLPNSYPALDQLLDLLKATPDLTIELRGHTDNVGAPEKNLRLSEQRVAAVKIYLVGLGIAEKRITGIGLGGAEPRASNAREATRRLNRRVEVRITGSQ